MLFIVQFIKFKPIIKIYKKLELDNYGRRCWSNVDRRLFDRRRSICCCNLQQATATRNVNSAVIFFYHESTWEGRLTGRGTYDKYQLSLIDSRDRIVL